MKPHLTTLVFDYKRLNFTFFKSSVSKIQCTLLILFFHCLVFGQAQPDNNRYNLELDSVITEIGRMDRIIHLSLDDFAVIRKLKLEEHEFDSVASKYTIAGSAKLLKDSLTELSDADRKKRKILSTKKYFAIGKPVEKLTFDLLKLDLTPFSNEYGDCCDAIQTAYLIGQIKYIRTAVEVHKALLKYINENGPTSSVNFHYNLLNKNLQLVIAHINYLANINYMQFNIATTSSQKLKGVNIYHDNDVFFGFTNEDKNYTGGGMLEFTTDYLKMRVVPWYNKDEILQYQGLIFGAEAYTPNIRDITDSVVLNQGYDSLDRPWASFQYVGRSKYRQHYRLPIRSKSYFKVGSIGKGGVVTVQSSIHKDLTVQSVKPYGWHTQVGHDGRLALQVDHKIAFLLREGGTWIGNNKNRDFNKVHANWPVIAGIRVGHQMTSLAMHTGYSYQDFKHTSGNGDIFPNSQSDYDIDFGFLIGGNYIVHNTMLEGFGVFSTYEDDENDDEPIDTYVLVGDQVERWIFDVKGHVSLRYKKTTLFYKFTISTRKFNIANADNEKWYGWASIGFNFKL